jgi:hypothetical protein
MRTLAEFDQDIDKRYHMAKAPAEHGRVWRERLEFSLSVGSI